VREIVRKLVAIGFLYFCSVHAAQVSYAHGPVAPLPVGHAVSLARTLLLLHHAQAPSTGSALALLFAKDRSALLFRNRVPGASGATSAFLLRDKAVGQAAFQEGKSSTIVNELSISSAQLDGVNYFRSSPTSNLYVTQGLHSVNALGSNPLNVSGVHSGATVTIPNYQTTYVNYQASAQPLPYPHKGTVFIKPPHLSGTQRTIQNEDKVIATTGFRLGQQSALQLGPIVGGRLFMGEYIYRSPNTYAFYKQLEYSFGTDPYNTLAIHSFTAVNPASFIDFASGKVLNITSGQFVLTRYLQVSGSTFGLYGGRFDAIGSNPYNITGPGGQLVTVSNTLNFLNF
jgi:hypothetical protein